MNDVRVVLLAALSGRLWTLVEVYLFHQLQYLGSWDASGILSLQSKNSLSSLEPLVRWDIIHFAEIAENGYLREDHRAFSPGAPLVMRTSKMILGIFPNDTQSSISWAPYVIGGSFSAILASTASAVLLYLITFEIFRNRRFALASALLYTFPPSPVVSIVPYTEPYFSFFSFAAILLFLRHWFFPAALLWGVATSFRPLGVLNVGFFIWDFLQTFRTKQFTSIRFILKLLMTLLFSSIVVAPFITFQYEAFIQFCTTPSSRPWCQNTIPLVYTFVQDKYWDVGPFRYWTFRQLPNFVLAAPILILSIAASLSYYKRSSLEVLFFGSSTALTKDPQENSSSSDSLNIAKDTYYNPLLAPFVHLHTFLTFLLLTSSHVQISLRQASTNPVIFWYAAHLSLKIKTGRVDWGKVWRIYSFVWGTISAALWSGFYPPA